LKLVGGNGNVWHSYEQKFGQSYLTERYGRGYYHSEEHLDPHPGQREHMLAGHILRAFPSFNTTSSKISILQKNFSICAELSQAEDTLR
jgi:hypothetical protein